ncbi:MAG: VOC family protein [Calditrichia bacterium]
MDHIINWFEIPVTDFERAIKFYSRILDVELERQNMGGYDMAFFPWGDKNVSGALVAGEGYKPSQEGTLVYLNGGEDLNSILSRVEDAGGKVITPKTEITPEIGHFAFFLDSEGNKLALHSQK